MKGLIINGDFKYLFVFEWWEKIEFRIFFEEVFFLVLEIVLVRGNYDVGVFWLKEFGVEIVDEFEIGRWKFVYGYKFVEGENFIIGYEYFVIRLRDEVGVVIKVFVFLMGKYLIVLLVFSFWVYGNDVLREIVFFFLKYR